MCLPEPVKLWCNVHTVWQTRSSKGRGRYLAVRIRSSPLHRRQKSFFFFFFVSFCFFFFSFALFVVFFIDYFSGTGVPWWYFRGLELLFVLLYCAVHGVPYWLVLFLPCAWWPARSWPTSKGSCTWENARDGWRRLVAKVVPDNHVFFFFILPPRKLFLFLFMTVCVVCVRWILPFLAKGRVCTWIVLSYWCPWYSDHTRTIKAHHFLTRLCHHHEKKKDD